MYIISLNMHKGKDSIVCKSKYAQNMHKMCKKWPQRYVSFAFICIHMQKCAKMCNICKHEIHMQKYAPLTLLMNTLLQSLSI